MAAIVVAAASAAGANPLTVACSAPTMIRAPFVSQFVLVAVKFTQAHPVVPVSNRISLMTVAAGTRATAVIVPAVPAGTQPVAASNSEIAWYAGAESSASGGPAGGTSPTWNRVPSAARILLYRFRSAA